MIAALVLVSGCARSHEDKLIDRAMTHLEAAERMLEEADRDLTALGLAVMHYRNEHRTELLELRRDADQALREADEAKRKEMAQRSQVRTAGIMNRLLAATQRFAKPRQAQKIIQPLILQTTPVPLKGPRKIKRPWMPPLPPLEADPKGTTTTPPPHTAPVPVPDDEHGHEGHAHGPAAASPTATGY